MQEEIPSQRLKRQGASADYRQLAGFKSKKEGTMSVTGERNELSSVNPKQGVVEST